MSVGVACERLDELSIDGHPITLRMTVDAFRGIDSDYEEAITRALGEISETALRGVFHNLASAVAQVQLMHPDLALAQDLWEQIDARTTETGPFAANAKVAFDAIQAVLNRDAAAARVVYEETRRRRGR